MKLLLAVVAGIIASVTASVGPAADSDTAAIKAALRATSSVSFYFVSLTDEYNFNVQEMEAHASVIVKRKCGGNCAFFMKPVISHLLASKKSNCLPGRQDVLIVFGSEHIMYNVGGRVAKYHGHCYYNPKPVQAVLKRGKFFFH